MLIRNVSQREDSQVAPLSLLRRVPDHLLKRSEVRGPPVGEIERMAPGVKEGPPPHRLYDTSAGLHRQQADREAPLDATMRDTKQKMPGNAHQALIDEFRKPYRRR